MPTVKVVDLLTRAATVLQDEDHVRWPLLELQDWLNDGYREVINFRPDAYTNIVTYVCSAGTKQSISAQFPSAVRLFDVIRNLAGDQTPVLPIPRKNLDLLRRAWHQAKATDTVEMYSLYDPIATEFFVYPPATAAARLELVVVNHPEPHELSAVELANAGTNETIRLADQYANALLDYVLYRAYTKDADFTANTSRAMAHYQAMQASLGVAAAGGS